MATVTRSAIAAVLNLIYLDDLVPQFRRDITLGNLLSVKPGRNLVATGRAQFDARTAGGAYAEGADMSDSDFDAHAKTNWSLTWAEYRTGAKVSGLAEAIAVASGGTGGVSLSEVTSEIRDAIEQLSVFIGADCYAGDPAASPVELAGAALAIDGSAGTFAGIASASYPGWLAGENTTALASLTFKDLRTKLFRPVKDAIGVNPEFVTCDGSTFDELKSLFDDRAETIQQVMTAGRGPVDVQLAFGGRAMSLDGVPFVEDRHATASTLYAWHSRFVEFQQVPIPTLAPQNIPNIIAAFKALTGMIVTESDIVQMITRTGGALTPSIEALGQTGDAYKFQVKWYGQLCWKRRNAFAKLGLT